MAGKTPKSRRRAKLPDKEERALARATTLLGKDPSLSKAAALRGAGIKEARDVRRLVAKLVPPARKAKSNSTPRKAAGNARAQTAALLRASEPKKVGAVARHAPAKPSSRASYHPKTELPPLTKLPTAGLTPVPDLMALARPWMMLGFHMTAASLAMQTRVAKAAMNITPATAAMQQGSEAVNAWLNAVGGQRPKQSK